MTHTTLFTILCASTLAMAPLVSGCFGGCGTYDPQGNHVDMPSESDPEVSAQDCSCVQSYGSASMDEAAIQKLATDGLSTCFGKDPTSLESQAACLPTVVGTDARNSRDLQVYYYCSDNCPDAGYVGVTYKDVADKSACCALGGEPVIDAAFGAYVACAPAGLGTGDSKACAQ